MITIKEQQEIKRLLKGKNSDQLVFWVGAGISSNAPSCLPLGYELLLHILQHACGKDCSEKIINIWEENNEYLNANGEISNGFGSMPRLETIIEELMIAEKAINENKITNGLSSFTKIPHNEMHVALAHFLSKGANVVTTNYDFGIQDGLTSIDKSIKWVQNYKEGIVYGYEPDIISSGGLFHIHGVADNLKELGVNLSNIKNGLPNTMKEKIRQWIAMGKTFVFIGYGGVDSFDINPFFQELENAGISGNKDSIGIYIRHELSGGRKGVTEKEKILLAPFLTKYICCADTNEFMRQIVGDNICFESSNRSGNFKWKEEFDKYVVELNNEEKNLFLCRLSYVLGINVDLISDGCIEKFIFSEVIKPSDKHSASIGMYSLQFKREKLLEIAESKNGQIGTYSGLLSHAMEFEKSKDNSFTLDEIEVFIEKCTKEGNPLKWDVFAALNQHTRCLLFRLTRYTGNLNEEIMRQEKDSILILKCCQLIIKSSNSFISNLNQKNSAARDYATLEAIYNQKFEKSRKALDDVLYYYCETSSMDGVRSIFRRFAYLDIIEFYYTHDKKHIDDYRMHIRKANQMAELNQDLKQLQFNKFVIELADKVLMEKG